MFRRPMISISRTCCVLAVCAVVAPAQWLSYPTPGLPRLADGKPNLAAPTPKTADGKPDLTGVWLSDSGKYYRDLAADVPGGAPMLPWAEKFSKEKDEENHKADPLAQCMPPGVPRVNTH